MVKMDTSLVSVPMLPWVVAELHLPLVVDVEAVEDLPVVKSATSVAKSATLLATALKVVLADMAVVV